MRTPPFTFGGYEVAQVIASGSMGVVYRARQRMPERWVALKMVLGTHGDTEEVVRRFRAEAAAASRLDHPAIVPIYDVGECDGQPYFTMRLLEGGSLEMHAREYVGDVSRTTETVQRVAEAIDHAHRRGVLHRDLKPANILLEADGSPVVSDFGLARLVSSEASRHTQTGAIVGTPAYMAPEQAQANPQAVTTASDVWSLGVILYEMLTGRLPFEGRDTWETLQRIVSEEPAAPSEHLRGVPRDVETICLKCLQKEPAARYASAGALAEDLGRFRRGDPVLARPPGRIERAFRWMQRHRATTATAVVLVLALVGASVAYLSYLRERATTERSARSRAYLKTAEARSDQPLIAALYRAAAFRLDPRLDVGTAVGARRPSFPRRIVHAERGVIWRVAFDADGGRMAIGAAGGFRCYDVREDRFLPAFPGVEPRVPVRGLAFHPDGKRLATGDEQGTATVWDTASGRVVARKENGQGATSNRHAITSMAYLRRGDVLVYGGTSDRLYVWEPDSGRLDVVPYEPSAGIPRATIREVSIRYVDGDALGDRALVGVHVRIKGETREKDTSRHEVRLWDLGTRVFLPVSLPTWGTPWCASFSPDGSSVALSEDRGVCLWDSKRTEASVAIPWGASVGAVALARDGRSVVCGDVRGRVVRFDLESGYAIGARLLHPQEVFAVALTPDGTSVATGCKDGMVRLWWLPEGPPPARVLHGFEEETALAFGTDERRLVVGTGVPRSGEAADRGADQGEIVLVDVERGVVLDRTPCAGIPREIETAGDAWWAVTDDGDRTGRLLDIRVDPAGRLDVRTKARIRGLLASPRAYPESGLLYASNEAGVLRRWRVQEGEVEPDDLGSDLPAVVSGFGPYEGGRSLAVVDLTPTLRVFASGAAVRESRAIPLPPGITSVAASPSGHRFAVWHGYAAPFLLLDGRTGRNVGPALGGRGLPAQFSPDGALLVTGIIQSGWVQFLDTRTGQPVGPVLEHEGPRESLGALGNGTVRFAPSGDWLAVPVSGGPIYVWDLSWRHPANRLDPAEEWERAQLAALWTIDEDGVERPLRLGEWRERRERWARAHGED